MPTPTTTTSPGRQVRPGSPAAQWLAMHGLQPTDVPRAADGGDAWVSEAEVLAELARRGIPAGTPSWERPPLPEQVVRPRVRALLGLGAHLLRLAPWAKLPVDFGWPDLPPLGEDDAVTWVCAGGGNLAINLLASRWVVLDAENAAATAVLVAAGLVPTAVPANAQNAASPKAGGVHVYAPLPDGLDPATLRSRLGVPLPGGGQLDVLMGARFAVAPCSRLITAGAGVMYDFAEPSGGAGVFAGVSGDGAVIVDRSRWTPPPAWLLDADAPAPAVDGIEALHGVVAPPPPKQRREPSPGADRVTAEIDAIGWDEWIGDDARVQIIGADGTCGCDVFHWLGAATDRSGILHDGCGYGCGVHIFSGSCRAALGDCDEHMSRLTFAALLRGQSPAETAREFGIDLTTPLTAVEVPDIPLPPAPLADNVIPFPPRIDNIGGGVWTAPPLAAAAPADADTDADTGPEVDLDLDVDLPPAAKDRLMNLRREVAALEAQLAAMTPGLARADRLARCGGVYLHGLLSALIVRTLANVPPNVMFPSAAGLTMGKEVGTAVNANAVLVGPSGTGKTVTSQLARAAVRLGHGVIAVSDGTAEGICRKARTFDGEDYTIHATGLLVETDEFDSVAAEMARPNSKLDAFTRRVWTGESAGSTASDKHRDAQLPQHSTRVCLLYGGQPQSLAPLLAMSHKGTPQRFDFALVGLVRPQDRDPQLYGTDPAEPFLRDQDRLPWTSPTGLPSGYRAPDQRADATAEPAADGEPTPTVAEAVSAALAKHGGGAKKREGLLGFDDAAPIWIPLPEAVREAVAAEADRAARRSEDWLHALAEDKAGISGHLIPLRLRFAFAFAVWDGIFGPQEVHWEAAGLYLRLRQLVADAAADVARMMRDEAAAEEGQQQGVRLAVADAARTELQSRAYARCVEKLFRLIDAATGQYPELAELAEKARKQCDTAAGTVFVGGGLHTKRIGRMLSAPQRASLPQVLKDLKARGAIAGDTVVRRAEATVLQMVPPGAS